MCDAEVHRVYSRGDMVRLHDIASRNVKITWDTGVFENDGAITPSIELGIYS